MLEMIILIFLIFLNGLFVMTEIALVSARKSRLEHLADEGDEKARAALKLAENPELFLPTAQIGITLIAILTGFYSGEKFSADLQPYLELSNQMALTGTDLFGQPYGPYSVDSIPRVSDFTFSMLSDVAPPSFWSPYY